jgi:AraC-like DNA-binding protein/quercetin dioxygenase-like cupin family protein
MSKEILGKYRLDIEVGGHVVFDTELSNSRHKHDYFELCLVLGGTGMYEHGGNRWRLGPGDVFLAAPGFLHEISSYETKDLQLYFVSVGVSQIESESTGPEDRIVESFLKRRQTVSPSHHALSGYVPLLDGGCALPSMALRLFTLDMMAGLAINPPAASQAVDEGDVDKALAYVKRNLTRSLRVKEIADHVGVSERTLRRRFQETMGKSLLEEIRQRRMMLAAHRLLMGFGVQEVSDYIGLSDPAQFTRSFKQVFNVSPKRFQSSYLPGSLSKSTAPEVEEKVSL